MVSHTACWPKFLLKHRHSTLVFCCIAVTSIADAAPQPRAAAARLSGSITLDGKLDEPAWQGAKSFTPTQQAPKPGQPTPYADHNHQGNNQQEVDQAARYMKTETQKPQNQ